MGRNRRQDWVKMHYLQNFSLQINQGTLMWQSVFTTNSGNQCIRHFGILLVLRPIMWKSGHVSKPKTWRIFGVTSHWWFSLHKMHLTCFLEKTFPNLFQGSQFLSFINNFETLTRKPAFWCIKPYICTFFSQKKYWNEITHTSRDFLTIKTEFYAGGELSRSSCR